MKRLNAIRSALLLVVCLVAAEWWYRGGCTPPPPPASVHPFHDGYDLNRGPLKINATLTPTTREWVIGQPYMLDLSLVNKGQDIGVFNPEFHPLQTRPGALAVYDAQHRFKGDYVAFMGGSMSGSRPVTLKQGTSVDHRFELVAGRWPQEISFAMPPGTYYFQVICYNALVSDHFRNAEEAQGELFRSNLVEIKLVRSHKGG